MIDMLRLDRSSWLSIFHEAAIKQLENDLNKQGYRITREQRFGKYTADLVAEKEGKTQVYEIKIGDISPSSIERITAIKEAIEAQADTTFHLIFASPKEKTINIDGIDDSLHEYFENDIPEDILTLASHQSVTGVGQVDLSSIHLDGDEIHVKGDGILYVELQYGSDADVRKDDGLVVNDALPFTFECTLDSNLAVSGMQHVEVDKSSFYE